MTVAGGPALVSSYPVVPPVVDAVTVKAPGTVFAVSAGDVACPFASVVTTTDVLVPANVPLAPVAGAENVTVAPATGRPVAGFTTLACSGVSKVPPVDVVCPEPPVQVIGEPPAAGNTAEFSASLKTPDTGAVARGNTVTAWPPE